MHFTRWSLACGLMAVAIVAGCDCRGTGAGRSTGELSVDGALDFGGVFMGERATLPLTLRNVGFGPLQLERLEATSGEPVAIGEDADGALFSVRFTPGTLEGSSARQLEVSFAPPRPRDPSIAFVEHRAELLLVASNTRDGEGTARIELRGQAVSSLCDVPKLLDFGAVALGETVALGVPTVNPTLKETVASASEVSGSDRTSFTYAPGSVQGEVTLPAQSFERKVILRFSPTEAREYLGFVKVRVASQCPEIAVQLRGRGVTEVLTWRGPDVSAPDVVDFGFLQPSLRRELSVTFENLGAQDAVVSDLKVADEGQNFAVVSGGPLTVPAKGTATFPLAFVPAGLGVRQSHLQFKTSLARQPIGNIRLKGFSGGPKLQVTPSARVAFGKVAYFAGHAAYQARKISVMNVGARPPGSADPALNLKLASPLSPGAMAELKATGAGTDPAEFTLAMPPPCLAPGEPVGCYDPTVGLEATAGKNLAELSVKLTPLSLGPKEAELTFYSNDPTQPEVRLLITADVVSLPPCEYSVTPSVLNFGLVSPPNQKELRFTVRNLGLTPGSTCLLSDLDVGPGSSAQFDLPEGPVASKELQPGEAYEVRARVWPKEAAVNPQLSGRLELYLSSPTQPKATVQLQAMVGNACLTIAPDDVDFGTLQRGCASATRTFALYNTCPQPVRVTAFDVQAGAGQAAGGPDCVGPGACPEFSLVADPLPPGGVDIVNGALSPTVFRGRYRPLDLGADTGAFAVSAVQNGLAVTYVVTLSGRGDTSGQNTDVFKQDVRKADLLLVLDNSCSMNDEQASLASNFNAFIQFASQQQVDWQIGVTTTDMQPGGEEGRLVGDGNNPRILTPSTPDVANKFKAKVNLGTFGSGTEMGFEPALRALTAPLSASDNAGFVRSDANLAVVVISDEEEQSPQASSYYLSSFLNIKGFKRANQFSFSAIAGFVQPVPTGCAYSYDATERYRELVLATDGVKENICTANWAKSLEELGRTAFGYRATFFLNAVPDLTGGRVLGVRVDGVAVPELDGLGIRAWTYDPVANAVRFEPAAVPTAGQTLTVSYNVGCLP